MGEKDGFNIYGITRRRRDMVASIFLWWWSLGLGEWWVIFVKRRIVRLIFAGMVVVVEGGY